MDVSWTLAQCQKNAKVFWILALLHWQSGQNREEMECNEAGTRNGEIEVDVCHVINPTKDVDTHDAGKKTLHQWQSWC